MAHRTDARRSITAEDFARLLARLHPDAEQAGQEYERLRRALLKFFDWRGAWLPEECADETIDRLARKLEQTAVENVPNYAHGIARLVLLERRRWPVVSSIEGVKDGITAAIPPEPEEDNGRLDCFDRCLDELSAEHRTLLLRYYEGERQAKISGRRRLAASIGVTDSALRNRVQRLRERLEACVRRCASALE